jgi:hypothetical protein
MKEQEVFDLFTKIDGKLDKIAECRIDDLKAINAALEKKANQETVDKDLTETRGMLKWMAGGACVALMVLFGYTVILKADISRLQTTVIGVHSPSGLGHTVPAIESMVRETGGDK